MLTDDAQRRNLGDHCGKTAPKEAAMRAIIKKYAPAFLKRKLDSSNHWQFLESMSFPKSEDAEKHIRDSYNYQGDFLELYPNVKTGIVHKWHHFLPLYDRYLSKFRSQAPKLLEIGVSEGGSLSLWRDYFGSEAIIFGLDVNNDCARFDSREHRVRIGSQDDEAFLHRIVDEMNGLDIVIDDGSHVMSHIRKSLETLYPRLSPGGVYIVEDLHTSFWPAYGGGYNSKQNFFYLLYLYALDIHHWYHKYPVKFPQIASQCTGIHVHDSFVAFEKNNWPQPKHSTFGTKST